MRRQRRRVPSGAGLAAAAECSAQGRSGQQTRAVRLQRNDCNGQVDDEGGPAVALCGGDRRCAQGAAGRMPVRRAVRGGAVPAPGAILQQRSDQRQHGERASGCERPCGKLARPRRSNTHDECSPNAGRRGGLPLCVCKGTAGCHSRVQRDCGRDEQRVRTQGPSAGTASQDTNCNFFTAARRGTLVTKGSCLPESVLTQSVWSNEVCKPKRDFTSYRCEGQLAGMTCPAGESVQGRNLHSERMRSGVRRVSSLPPRRARGQQRRWN